jgi:hypothetical protein
LQQQLELAMSLGDKPLGVYAFFYTQPPFDFNINGSALLPGVFFSVVGTAIVIYKQTTHVVTQQLNEAISRWSVLLTKTPQALN